jgi:hypothetical protein
MTLDTLHNPYALYYISAALMLFPMARVFKRAGFRSYWALLLGIPDAGLIFCMVVLALRKWPAGKGV